MTRETYINPQSFVIFKETGIVPTVPDPVTLRKFHANFLETDLEVGTWARNVKDGKLWYRNETEIIEYEDDLFGPGIAAYHNHDDLYVKIGEGGAPVDLNDWFEIVNEGEADEYLRCKKPLSGDYEIQAWTDEGQFPGTIWESMPVATTSSVGGFQLDNNATHFYNGTGNWVAITSGTFDHAGLQHLAYADSGHTGFAPTIHNFIDTDNHPVSGLTAGHFLRALSATTYGFEAVAVAYVTGTPENNQIAVWTNANTIEGTSGITYDGTTFAITGNITATGEISAFTGDAPANWWEDMPLAEVGIRGGIDLPNNADLYLNGLGDWVEIDNGGSGMSWPSGAGIALYSGYSSWSTSITNNSANWNTAYGWGNHAGLYTAASHAGLTNNPHVVTAAQVGLGNVTNESKATMFSSPTFTGNIYFPGSGIWNSSGNMGVGEPSPASKLTVRADSASGRGGEISIVNYSSGNVGASAALNFGLEASTYAGDDGNAQVRATISNGSTKATDLSIHVWNGSVFQNRFTIYGNGSNRITNSTSGGDADSWFPYSDGSVYITSTTQNSGVGRINFRNNTANSTYTEHSYFTSEGTLVLQGIGGNYNENLRCRPNGSTGYSSIVLGAVSGDSGTGVGQWTLVRYPSASNYMFAIRYNATNYLTILTDGSIGVQNDAPVNTFVAGSSTKASNSWIRADAAAGYQKGICFATGGSVKWHMYIEANDDSSIRWYDSSGLRMHLTTSGNLNVSGEVTAYYSSDQRLKHNIRKFSALEKIDRINPVAFNWNAKAKELNSSKDDRVNYGVIAQDLEQVMPELVHGIYDNKYKSVDYVQLVPVLIQAVKELKSVNNELKKEIDLLHKHITNKN